MSKFITRITFFVLATGLAFFVLSLPLSGTAQKRDIKRSSTYAIPGCSSEIEWTARYAKTPGLPSSVHFWFDVQLADTDSSCKDFVVCAMLNLDKPWIKGEKYTLEIDPGQCACNKEKDSSYSVPNVHLGCKQVSLTSSDTAKSVFDTVISFTRPFSIDSMNTAYVDFTKGCSNQLQCPGLRGSQNSFLFPFDNQDEVWVNGWVTSRGLDEEIPDSAYVASGRVSPGNSFTMKYDSLVYELAMRGSLTNIPEGAKFIMDFPPGIIPDKDTVTAFTDTVYFDIPYTITDSFPTTKDIFIDYQVSYNLNQQLPLPEEPLRFNAGVFSRDSVVLPNGKLLYGLEEFTHNMDLQMVDDRDSPTLINHFVEKTGNGRHEVFVEANDPSMKAIAASIRVYYPDSIHTQPIDWDSPALTKDGATRFRDTMELGNFDRYEILIADDVNNQSTFSFGSKGFSSTHSQKAFTVFPNPGKGWFTVKFDEAVNEQKRFIEVFTLRGKPVWQTTINAGVTKIDLTNQKPGIYLIQIETQRDRFTKKVTLIE